MADSIFETRLTAQADGDLPAELLAADTGLSRQRIKLAMRNGAVWLARNGNPQRLRRATRKLQPGDELMLNYNARIIDEQPQAALLVADEGDYSVWNKPAGMLSQGSKWGDHCAISRWVEQHLKPERPAYLVHRLDRAASGLIIIAHGRRTAASLAAQFEQRSVAKHYRVMVHGIFGDIGKRNTIATELDGREAISHVTPLKHDANTNLSLLDVEIETGRKHQIRRHLSAAGHPVVGDRLYGSSDHTKNLQLTACAISLTLPDNDVAKNYSLEEQFLPHW